MELEPLPLDAGVDGYLRQAELLLEAFHAGDRAALEAFRRRHPRFLDPRVPWLPRSSPDEVRGAALGPEDARLAVARFHDFDRWESLVELVLTVAERSSPVSRFERAVEAAVDGDLATLEALLAADPGLVRARSTRVTHFDPPVHGATLLHYLAANGVEGHRQRTPANAVAVARLLLERGADPNALASMYGGRCTTLSLLVSSSHPAAAGLQVPLVDVLVDFGASVEPVGEGDWTSPLLTALAFGFGDAAEALARRGARVDSLPAAAGLGRREEAERLLPHADATARHRALALAAQLGHAELVRLLLDSGEDPDRYNPPGNHAHSTPLHQAALLGHDAVVRLLVERGARVDLRDAIYGGTPLGWARQGGQKAIAEYLLSLGAP